MSQYKYLLVGGGMTAASAIKGIRSIDKEGSIGLIGADSNPPYDRPPLTKGLWKGDKVDSIWRDIEGDGVEMVLGKTVRGLDPANKRVVDEGGTEYGFEKLLLATGVSPRRFDFNDEGILYYRTFRDYERLRSMTESGRTFAAIGGGFIGSEISTALAMNDREVVLAFPGAGIGANMFPAGLSEFLNGYYREKGVQVQSGKEVFRCEKRDAKYALGLRDQKTGEETEHVVDGVVAGIGTTPNVGLAQEAGLKVDNGIRVDEFLRTDHPDIYAAGDVACFHDASLDVWRRVEHEDNANTMGECAGKAMAGQGEKYTHLPFFYSDLFDLGYEAVGNLDARLEIYSDWKEPFKEGVVYYLREGRVRGVLLWNVWEQVDAARKLIASPGPFSPGDLKGRLPE